MHDHRDECFDAAGFYIIQDYSVGAWSIQYISLL